MIHNLPWFVFPFKEKISGGGAPRATTSFYSAKLCIQDARTRKETSVRNLVLEIEKGTFSPLVPTTTGEIREECLRYHRRLAEYLAMKKGEDYAKTRNWMRVKISFSLIRSALVCGSRSIRRKFCSIIDIDIDIQTAERVLEVRGSNTNLWVSRSGFFL